MGRAWIALPCAATALVAWVCAHGASLPARGATERTGMPDPAGIEPVQEAPAPEDDAAAHAGPVDRVSDERGAAEELPRLDWLARVDSVFEGRTTLRAKIAICAEAARHIHLGADEGRIWSFAQGIAEDAEFRIDAWDLIREERDADVLLWLGHWLRMGLLGPEPGGRRTGMIPYMLQPWQRRRAAIHAACGHVEDPETRPPPTVWSALRSVLVDETHPTVLLAAIEQAGCDASAPVGLLSAAVSRLEPGEEQERAARIVARRPPSLAEACRLLDLAPTDAARALWSRALADRDPPREESDPESAAAFVRIYAATRDPEGRLAMLRSPECGWCLRATLRGLLAEEADPGCRERLGALLAPRARRR